VQRWSWQNLLLEHDHPPECVAKVLRPDLPCSPVPLSLETPRAALSRLAWAHEKAVELVLVGGCYDPRIGSLCLSRGVSSLPRPHADIITAAPPAATATKNAILPPALSAMSPAVHAPTAAPTPSAVIVQLSPSVSASEGTSF
jgi:hypothetical protein